MRTARWTLGLAACALFCSSSALAEPVSMADAVSQNVFINCLQWTREGLPVSELASEGGLTRVERVGSPGSDSHWTRTFGAQRLTLVQHNDGSRACSIFFWTQAPDNVVQLIEGSFSKRGEGWPLDFQLVEEILGEKVVSRRYRQQSDQRINLTVSKPVAPSSDAPSLAVTFYHSR